MLWLLGLSHVNKSLKFIKSLILSLLIILFWILNNHPALAVSERTILTDILLQERLSHPVLNDGALIIDLQNLDIDLTPENVEFRDQFYQQLQSQLNRSVKPLGLDLTNSLIRGDFNLNKLGFSVQLSQTTFPQKLMASEQQLLASDPAFVSELGEQTTTLNVFRGLLKFNNVSFLGKTDFSKTFFLQRVEGKNAKFGQDSIWTEARFGRDLDLSQALFKHNLDFSQVTLFGANKFRQTKFQGITDFKDSHFWTEANFQGARFLQLVYFTDIQWLKDVHFEQVHWSDRVLFSQSHFFQNLDFNNATFEKSAAFRSVRFNNSIDFADVKLLGQLDFSNAIFFPKAQINVSGLAFDSDQAKLLGDKSIIGKVISLSSLEDNETVIRSLVRNFRNLEQIPDANQVEYTAQQLKSQQLTQSLLQLPKNARSLFNWIAQFNDWLMLNGLLLFSNYGTNVKLVLGVGIITVAYFGAIFWLLDRVRRWHPFPILPDQQETIYLSSSFIGLMIVGLTNIFTSTTTPYLTLLALVLLLIPVPAFLIGRLYYQGRYHDLLKTSYLTQDGSMRQLRLLIVRLPIIPEFPLFRERYTYLNWERHWNWLNYYDFSCNNLIKIGFNDIRLRDEHLPGIVSFLGWYQWILGVLYVSLLLWTVSRTVPGLNLLIYLR
ncbi:MAG: pentapeptide repeat-containing protein [Snowella sp.]|nr:pentapeptide repeat-containing protein [Snowella sp.]